MAETEGSSSDDSLDGVQKRDAVEMLGRRALIERSDEVLLDEIASPASPSVQQPDRRRLYAP